MILRRPGVRTLVTTLLGVCAAVFVGIVVLQVQGYEPARSFFAILNYSLFNQRALFNTLAKVTPLLLTGVSACVAFGSGAINLGLPGQLILGSLSVTLFGLWIDASAWVMVPLLLGVSMGTGALWAGAAAFLRRRFNMDEFITTLMLNFVADYFALYMVIQVIGDTGLSSAVSPPINPNGVLPTVGTFPSEVLVAFVACCLVFVWMRYTRVGYEMRLLGQNAIFTRTGGCNNVRNFSFSMLASGALAGLAGGLLIMGGQQHRFIRGIGANYAWDGVMIAIVAAAIVSTAVFYALFFAILQTGSLGMEIETRVPSEFVLVFQAFVVLFIVAARESAHILLDKITISIRSRSAGGASTPP